MRKPLILALLVIAVKLIFNTVIGLAAPWWYVLPVIAGTAVYLIAWSYEHVDGMTDKE
jgi:hypothetical protein